MPARHPAAVHHVPVATTLVTVAAALALGLTGCSGGSAPTPSATHHRSAVPSDPTDGSAPTAGGGATSGAGGSTTPGATSGTAPATASGTGTSGTASGSGAAGTGSGSGGTSSGTTATTPVDVAGIAAQGVAAAGGGTVIAFARSGVGLWTVLVVGSDGTETQSVVAAASERVTSGPFPAQTDAATLAADTAAARSATVDVARAASVATTAAGGTVTSLRLAPAGASARWTVQVSASGGVRTVVVDARSGSVLTTS